MNTFFPNTSGWLCTSLSLAALATTTGCLAQVPPVLAVVVPNTVAQTPANVTPYSWKNVAIGGGGFVTGIALHPKAKDLVYIRTDVGGAYRWNPANNGWIPLNDDFTKEESHLYGIESLALDPQNTNIVYVACGKYAADWGKPGLLMKSTDRGDTWTRLAFPPGANVKMGGNQDLRWGGERLAVSPTNGNIVLFGSRSDGLWRTADAGKTWKPILFGTRTKERGVSVVTWDKTLAGQVYATVDGDGIYRSTNSGLAWAKLAGSPAHSLNTVAVGGTLYATHDKGVLKRTAEQTAWQNITPDNRTDEFNGLALNPRNPAEIMVARGSTDKSTPIFWLSKNGGASWTAKPFVITDNELSWAGGYNDSLPSVAGLAFDPFTTGRVWFTNWFATYRTDDVSAPTIAVSPFVKGHEELVVFAFAPLSGTNTAGNPLLLTGVADLDGFHHNAGYDARPYQVFGGSSGPWLQDTYSIAAFRGNVPGGGDGRRVVRVGGNRWNAYQDVLTSVDHGYTWAKTTWSDTFAGVRPVRVAMSAGDADNYIVLANGSTGAKITQDNGTTWATVTGLPVFGEHNPFYFGQPLCADGATGGTFYYYDSGKVYRSTDKGATFAAVNSAVPSDAWASLKAAPEIPGSLFLSVNDGGLFHSTDGGVTWKKIATVQQAHLMATGAPQTAGGVPAVYVYGTVNAAPGLFRSLNNGGTWTRISDSKVAMGDEPTVMEASASQFGTVFVGTNGRGAYYGKPR